MTTSFTYRVSNETLFAAKVRRVETEGSINRGNVLIITTDGENIEQDGQFGKYDFEAEFGFVLITTI